MVPIAKLPVEIFVRIFRELRDMHDHLRPRAWILVTHVCRTWRLAALDAAELWTQIDSLDPNCVQAFLIRSKCAPLDICYLQGGRRDSRLDTIVPMALSESSRFRRVELAHSGTAHTFLVHNFPGGAPLLSHLTLRYIFISEAWTLETVTALADVVPYICEHGLPALRRLQLAHWPVASLVSLRGLLNPSLRSLLITEPHARHSPGTWADILKGLPLLEELTLASVFPSVEHGDVPSARQEQLPSIYLPHLSLLKILDDELPDQLSLLRCIVPSGDPHITLKAGVLGLNLPITFEQYLDILHTLSEKFAQERQKTFIYPTSLDLRFVTDVMSEFDLRENSDILSVKLSAVVLDDLNTSTASSTYCSRWSSDSDTAPILMLSCRGLDVMNYDFYTPLGDMLRTTFAWSALHKLSLAPSHISTPAQDALVFTALKSVFLQMVNLRVLTIANGYTSDSLLALLGSFDAPVESEAEGRMGITAKAPFPALEILIIEGRPHGEKTGYASLRRALLSRKEAGFSTPRVHICLYRWRFTRRVNSVEVAPLTTMGCAVDVCTSQGGCWCIEEFAAAL